MTRWGINVFKISELSNSRPLTAVAYTVFQERDLINQFKIPPTSLLSLLLCLYLLVLGSAQGRATWHCEATVIFRAADC